MKKIVSLLALLTLTLCMVEAKPKWVKKRPVNPDYYIGIAMASPKEDDYLNKAKEMALNDLISEIEVTISSTSLFRLMQENAEVTSEFEQKIKMNTMAQLSDYETVGTWQNKKAYWIYIRISKAAYAAALQARIDKATREGVDYLGKGDEAVQNGDVATALDLYLKGLNVIEPVITKELPTFYKGASIDVGRELFHNVSSLLSDVTITPYPNKVAGYTFHKIEEPVVFSVKKNGTPLKNVQLKLNYNKNECALTSGDATDIDGNLSIYIQNIISKSPRIEVSVEMVSTPFRAFKSGIYGSIVERLISDMPKGTFFIEVKTKPIIAFLKYENKPDAGVKEAVIAQLTKNYFNIGNRADNADVIITLSSDFHKGELVRSGITTLVEYFISCGITIANRSNGEELLNYRIENQRVLQPQNASMSQAKNAAILEMNKRLTRQFAEELRNVRIE